MHRSLMIFAFLLLGGCQQQDSVRWQGYCLPKSALTPASKLANAEQANGFDTNSNYGVTLFFDGEAIKQDINNFKAVIADPLFGQLHHHLQVSFLNSQIDMQPKQEDQLVKSEIDGLFFDMQSEYDWHAYRFVDGAYHFFGSCMRDSSENKQAYSCMRQLKLDDVTLSFDLDYENMAIYQEIDQFLVERLSQWRCDSKD